jgi:hypothetical protein
MMTEPAVPEKTVIVRGFRTANPAYFLGRWKCGDVPWIFVKKKMDAWIEVRYGNPAEPDGVARFGYVEALKRYVYRDFHFEGSYADLTATFQGGKTNGTGRWEFTGPYYPAHAATPLYGVIAYQIIDKNRYDRSFASKQPDGTIKKMGSDTCRRVS